MKKGICRFAGMLLAALMLLAMPALAAKVSKVTIDFHRTTAKQYGILKGLDASGKKVWSYRTSKQDATELDSAAFAVRGSYVYLIDYDRYICLKKQTGKKVVSRKLPAPIWGASLAVDSGRNLYAIGYYDEDLYKISRKGRVVWKHTFSNLYWPYKVWLSGNSVKVLFDNFDDPRTMSVNKETGR